jgi:hypothetical protein
MFGHTWPFLPSGNEPSGATTIEDQELPGCLAGEWLNEYQMQITPQESHVQSDRAPQLANTCPVLNPSGWVLLLAFLAVRPHFTIRVVFLKIST